MVLNGIQKLPLHDPGRSARILYRSGNAVKRWVRHNNGSAEDAEDLLQDAVIATLNLLRKPDFELRVPYKNLLFAVARKMWLHHLRQRQLSVDLSPEDEMAIFDHDNDWLEEEQRMHAAEKTLETLGERCRRLLEFFYLEKRSMEWISEKMGFRNRHVVKSMKVKCLGKARDLIQIHYHERTGQA